MRKIILGLATTLALSSLGGCMSFYTDIRKNDDGSYILTQTTQGFFRVYGEVYRCTPQGNEKLVCQSIDRL